MNSSGELSKKKTESNRLESQSIFKNLKSDYFLKKLFYNILKKRSLDIIKYNNNLKNRININFQIIKNIQKYIHQLK